MSEWCWWINGLVSKECFGLEKDGWQIAFQTQPRSNYTQ